MGAPKKWAPVFKRPRKTKRRKAPSGKLSLLPSSIVSMHEEEVLQQKSPRDEERKELNVRSRRLETSRVTVSVERRTDQQYNISHTFLHVKDTKKSDYRAIRPTNRLPLLCFPLRKLPRKITKCKFSSINLILFVTRSGCFVLMLRRNLSSSLVY